MGNLSASISVGLIDRVSKPAQKISKSLKRIGVSEKQLKKVSKAANNFGKSLGNTTNEAKRLTGKLALLGGAGLWFVKSQLVDTAAQFEKFKTVLETVEGSSDKAKTSMDWVSSFATKTPYELDQVMESFVRLRTYGLDPTNGLLKTLGDTASAMGKPIMQAVEAIADAVTGENERLKEFGITSETRGDKTRYSYTDKAGKQQYKIVDKYNRKMIESTLLAIWNEKYGGAMDKQSKTWAGMVSNLADQWTRFKVTVMDAGLFDWLKGKLGNLLATLDRMAADGSLQRLAEDIGSKLKDGFTAAWAAGQAFARVLQQLGIAISWLASSMGGYENLAMAVTALMAGKMLISVASLTASIFSLGKSALPLATSGLKALIPVLSKASAAGAGLAPILGKAGLVGAAGLGGYGVGTVLNKGIGKGMSWLTDGNYSGDGAIGEWLYDAFHPKAAPSESISSGGVQNSPIDVGGEIMIKIESDQKTKITKIESNNNNIDIDIDSGPMMISP